MKKEIKSEFAKRASEETILSLIEMGLLRIGEDNKIHCVDVEPGPYLGIAD